MNGGFTKLVASLLAITAWHTALAFDPGQDRIVCNNAGILCLTSFMWCSTMEEDNNKGCTYPENTWKLNVEKLPRDKGQTPALVLWNTTYTASWISDDTSDIQLYWTFGEIEKVEGGTREWTYSWLRNFTEGEREFTFRFIDLIQDFPTELTDITPLQAKEMATKPFNYFRIHQLSQRGSMEWSGRFAIVDEPILDFLDLRNSEGHKAEKKKWQMGVGIGVGIGVPLLLAVAFLVGRLMGRKRGSTHPAKRVESH